MKNDDLTMNNLSLTNQPKVASMTGEVEFHGFTTTKEVQVAASENGVYPANGIYYIYISSLYMKK